MTRALILAPVLALLLAGTAMGGRVLITGADDTRFAAGGKQVNDVTVRQEGLREFAVRDRAAKLRVGDGCFRTGAHSARCYDPRHEVDFTAGLGGGADLFKLTTNRSFARVYAGSGKDRMRAAGRAKIEFFSGAGNDTISVARTVRADILDGGAGNDRITGGDNGDELRGKAGDDILNGGGGSLNLVTGGDGDDVLSLTTGGGQVLGGPGNDRLTGGERFSRLQGGDGNDVIDAAASPGEEIVFCDAGADDTARMGPNDEFADGEDFDDVGSPAEAGCENVTQE